VKYTIISSILLVIEVLKSIYSKELEKYNNSNKYDDNKNNNTNNNNISKINLNKYIYFIY